MRVRGVLDQATGWLGLLFLITNGMAVSYGQAIPNNVSPGAIMQSQEQQLPLNENSGLRPAPKNETVPLEGVPAPQVPAGEEGPPEQSVSIENIIILGMTLLPAEEVAAIVAEYENRSLTFPEIQALADKLTALYQDAGYVTSSVYIPPQKLEGGDLQLQAIEGKVGTVTVNEGRFFKGRYVYPRLALKSGDTFNIRILKNNIQQLNQNPDALIQGGIQAGEKLQTTDLNLTIQEQRPWHFSLSTGNLGRRLTGDQQLSGIFMHNNLLGFGDKFLTSLAFSRHTQGVVNHYEVPIGSHGIVVGMDQVWSRLSLGREFEALGVKGGFTSYSPYISKYWISTDKLLLSTDLTLDFKQQFTDNQGMDFERGQLRVLRPGINIQTYDKTGTTSFREELGFGLNAFGAGASLVAGLPGNNDNNTFFRTTSSVTRVQKLPWNTMGIFRASGQFSPDSLLSTEQFQVGGTYTVRGYREGSKIGNSGFFISAEWRLPTFHPNLQLISFVDYGATYIKSSAANNNNNEQLLGMGVGLRAKLTKYLSLRMDLAVPMLRDAPFGQRPRLHFGLDAPLF